MLHKLKALLLALSLWSPLSAAAAPISRVLLASLIWNEPPARAVGLPHLSRRGTTLVLESDPPLPWPFPLQQLKSEANSRLQSIGSGTALIQKIGAGWQGAADPRREGTALALP